MEGTRAGVKPRLTIFPLFGIDPDHDEDGRERRPEGAIAFPSRSPEPKPSQRERKRACDFLQMVSCCVIAQWGKSDACVCRDCETKPRRKLLVDAHVEYTAIVGETGRRGGR